MIGMYLLKKDGKKLSCDDELTRQGFYSALKEDREYHTIRTEGRFFAHSINHGTTINPTEIFSQFGLEIYGLPETIRQTAKDLEKLTGLELEAWKFFERM